ncbi:MAG TPA: SRPBCC family protein [Acidimicrobiales bacterium]|nr:SRPBCC family protein [Acidimicrobiales bacterium]
MRRSCEATIDIEAPPAAVWAVVADVTRVGEWSGECRGCEWVDGATGPAVGARFRGHNRRAGFRWSRTNQVFAADEPTRLVWRTMPGGVYMDAVEWEVGLQERGAGTAARLSFSVVKLPKPMELLIDVLFAPHRDRSQDLAGDLGRLKALVEGAPAPGPTG